jgi:hypothetical protein
MTDRLFTAALTFMLLAGGTLAIGAALFGLDRPSAPTPQVAVIELPRVEVSGHRGAAALAGADERSPAVTLPAVEVIGRRPAAVLALPTVEVTGRRPAVLAAASHPARGARGATVGRISAATSAVIAATSAAHEAGTESVCVE